MKLFVVFLCLAIYVVNATPANREKRSAIAMAGAYPGFGGGFVGTGAYASSPGFFPFMFSPFDYPRAYIPMPWPVFTMPKPWYEGDNVCTTVKELQDPKELQEWFADASSPNFDYSHESEQCQGSTSKYVCFKRYVSNGESKMQATKYECCHGFVRNTNGQGCMESSEASGQTPGHSIEYYNVQNQAASTSASSSKKTGVEKVPVQ